jgi:ubiquinone/menaquinone biosynthesis C-methylase UbiE
MNKKNIHEKIIENINVHNKIARKYESLHGEIFNDIEQDRLFKLLTLGFENIKSDAGSINALDFGCGSGNLTKHLLNLGAKVTAADVSLNFLKLLKSKFSDSNLTTFLIEDDKLRGIENNAYDLVATYSVLHHIPDYLETCNQFARICRPGGIVIIDHEANEYYWKQTEEYRKFKNKAEKINWRKFFRPRNYYGKIRRIFDKKYAPEGDIHVWEDDHIEWEEIKTVFNKNKFEIIYEEDYLLYKNVYKYDQYLYYKKICTDTKVIIFKKSK